MIKIVLILFSTIIIGIVINWALVFNIILALELGVIGALLWSRFLKPVYFLLIIIILVIRSILAILLILRRLTTHSHAFTLSSYIR